MGATTVALPERRLGATRTPLIELDRVEKVYRMGRLDYPALRGIDLTVGAGELVAVVGPSGSGKTTILNMITGIDRPSAGTITVGGERIDQMSEEELAVWRGAHVGVVFQFFQLLPTLSALENAVLPLDFAHRGSRRERFEQAARSSGSRTSSITSPRSSRAASSSASRSRGHSPRARRSSSETSRPATSTRTRRPRCSTSSRA
jgi:ABC-type sugar transport system ATPase subunit